MEDIAEVVAAYIRRANENPPNARVTTREVVTELRRWLDRASPEWRWRAFAEAERQFHALVVELHLSDGRVLCGALTQRPSAAA